MNQLTKKELFDPQLALKNLKWLAIDLDKTLCASSAPDHSMGEPLPYAQEALSQMRDMGYKIVVYTARGWNDYAAVENWMNYYQIPFDRIECGKLLAKLLIDDRAFRFKDWKEDISKIKEILDEGKSK